MRSTLLIVDDDINVVRQLKWSLHDLYEVVHAVSVEEIRKCVDDHEPGVAMVDMHMPPELDSPREGLAVLARLHRERPDILLIGISASQDPTLGAKAAHAGAVLFLRKPFEDEYIRRVLSSL